MVSSSGWVGNRFDTLDGLYRGKLNGILREDLFRGKYKTEYRLEARHKQVRI
jgi:hypothetical protein